MFRSIKLNQLNSLTSIYTHYYVCNNRQEPLYDIKNIPKRLDLLGIGALFGLKLYYR